MARWNGEKDGSLEWGKRWLAGMKTEMARWNGEKDGSLEWGKKMARWNEDRDGLPEWGKRWLAGFTGMAECYCGTECCLETDHV